MLLIAQSTRRVSGAFLVALPYKVPLASTPHWWIIVYFIFPLSMNSAILEIRQLTPTLR